MEPKRSLIFRIRKRQLKFPGHIIAKGSLKNLHNSIRLQQPVPHLSTDLIRHCLYTVIKRKPVFMFDLIVSLEVKYFCLKEQGFRYETNNQLHQSCIFSLVNAVCHRYHIDITQISHRYHTDTADIPQISHKYHIPITVATAEALYALRNSTHIYYPVSMDAICVHGEIQ